MSFTLHPQTILCGMGELHIEIIHDRIRREYGIETHLGPLQVAYRETVLHDASTTGTANKKFLICALVSYPNLCFLCKFTFLFYDVDLLDRTLGEKRHVVTVELSVRPVDPSSLSGSCELAFTEELRAQLSQEMKDAVENGVHSSYLQGND